MNKLVLALPIAWSLLAGACQQDNKKMEADIAELKKGQAELLALVKAGGGRGAGAAAQVRKRWIRIASGTRRNARITRAR